MQSAFKRVYGMKKLLYIFNFIIILKFKKNKSKVLGLEKLKDIKSCNDKKKTTQNAKSFGFPFTFTLY